MRISSHHHLSPYADVFYQGEKVEHCFEVDTTEGWMLVWARDADGKRERPLVINREWNGESWEGVPARRIYEQRRGDIELRLTFTDEAGRDFTFTHHALSRTTTSPE